MNDPRDDLPEELLSAYLDGEVTADERASVEARLSTSAAWSQILREITDTRATVRALPLPVAPPGFWESVLIDDVGSPRRRLRVSRRLGWVASGAAAAIVGAAFLVPSPHTTTPPVATMVDAHASRASLNQDPITQLAPVGQPVKLSR